MSKAPTTCRYCANGTLAPPSSDGRTTCGFCDGGRPFDTQEDWDRTWGKVFALMRQKP